MRAIFLPPQDLAEILDRLKDRIDDWTAPMEKISRIMLEDTKHVFATGLAEWVPMSQATVDRWGPHPLLRRGGHNGSTPLEQWNQRAWSPKNAAVINRAPHAHLIEDGVQRYQTPMYQSGGRRRSRSSIRERLASGERGSMHSPPRDFLFVDEDSYPTFKRYILDHIETVL